MKLNPESLARASSRHPWRTVGTWAVILVVGFAASGVLLSSALTTDFDFTNNPEAKRALQILDQRKLEQDLIPETIVMTSEGTVQDPAFVDAVNAALSDLRALGAEAVTTVPSQFPLPDDQQSDPESGPRRNYLCGCRDLHQQPERSGSNHQGRHPLWGVGLGIHHPKRHVHD